MLNVRPDNLTQILQPIQSRLNGPIAFNGLDWIDNPYSVGVTLKMTSVEGVETSVTNNSSFNPDSDDHTRDTTDTPVFKPFTRVQGSQCRFL